MIDVRVSVEIGRPVAEVFTFITDLDRLPLWLEGVKEARSLSPDPDVVGARVAHVNEFMGQTFESTFEVLEWEPNELAVFKVLSGPLRGESRQTFEELDLDSTLVEIRVTGHGTGILNLGNFMAKRIAQGQIQRSLDTAKDLLESEGPSS